MSANLVVDLGNTVLSLPTVLAPQAQSGLICPNSGTLVGLSVDLLNANTACNVHMQGVTYNGSGQVLVAIQSSDSDTSGTFTDPTSGLAALPSWISSGGVFILNSGSLGMGTKGAQVSGQSILSGFSEFGYFQRPGRFARALILSGGFYNGPLQVNFVSQLKTIGSGAGFTFSPSSGTINV